MKLSIFTPTHNPKYLTELYESIKDQPFNEWVIVTQNCEIPDFGDKRIKVYPLPKIGDHYVGALKKYACSKCTGDILLELDHDDLLMDGAVKEVKKAFKDPEIGFVYSNFAEFEGVFRKRQKYDPNYGWEYRPFYYKGNGLDECLGWQPTASSISRIWFAPNHLRAWRKTVYDQIGGHDPSYKVLDDHELLIRTYLATKMKHIDKCLYLYRVTGENAWLKNNKEIQDGTLVLYHKYIQDLAIREAELRGLRKLDLGGRFNGNPKCETVDLKDADIIADLSKDWPWEDNSVGVIIANDFLEHIQDKLHVIKEIYRVLAPGGYLLASTPSTDSRGAFQDPTHTAYYNQNSFYYYVDQKWAQYIDTPVRFQSMRLYTTDKNEDDVSWVIAHLCALKGNRPPGAIKL